MKRFAIGLLYAVVGYLVGAMLGYALISSQSSNTHDVSVEAAMTGAFVFGPLGATIAFIGGLVRTRGTSSVPKDSSN